MFLENKSLENKKTHITGPLTANKLNWIMVRPATMDAPFLPR